MACQAVANERFAVGGRDARDEAELDILAKDVFEFRADPNEPARGLGMKVGKTSVVEHEPVIGVVECKAAIDRCDGIAQLGLRRRGDALGLGMSGIAPLDDRRHAIEHQSDRDSVGLAGLDVLRQPGQGRTHVAAGCQLLEQAG